MQTATDYGQLKEQHAELAETLALAAPLCLRASPRTLRRRPRTGHLFELPDSSTSPSRPRHCRTDTGAAATETSTRSAANQARPSPAHPHRARSARSEKTCSCCGGANTASAKTVSRELEFTPAKLEVNVHVLPKYACPKCRDGVASPPVPPKPIPGGIAGAGLVSFVIVSKFADHLPLYRLEDILTRHGVYLSRSTLCDWVRNAAVLLEPLAELQKGLVLRSPVLWTDDTHVTVLGGEEARQHEGAVLALHRR